MRIAFVAMCIFALSSVQVARVAASDINVAGLVVDYGDGRMSYAWVPFEEEEITGIELLKRSGLDVVTITFGGMGEGICQIDITGCPVDDCRKRMCQTSDPESPFWRYLRQADSGEWSFVALGASDTTVRDGDIDAWSWSGVEPELPPLTMDELADLAGADASVLEDAQAAPAAVVRTEGGAEEDDDDLSTGALTGAAAVAVIAVVAGFVVLRAKRAGSAGT